MSTQFASSQKLNDEQAEKRAIPKFASFKPKAPSKIQSREIQASENIHQLSKNHDDALYEYASHGHARGQHHSRVHDSGLEVEVNRHVRSHSAGQDQGSDKNTRKLFVVDRVGDTNNLKFGALDKYATASFFRFGAGNVVGSSMNERIDRVVSTEKGLVLSDHTRSLPNKRDKHTRWRLDQEGAKELKIRPREEQNQAIDLAADYVFLEAAKRAKRRRGDDKLSVDCTSSSDDQDTHYRSVEGFSRSKEEPVDQDMKYNSETSSSYDIAGNHHVTSDKLARKQRARFSKRIDAEPTNHEAWIDLISHQDIMLGLGQDFKRTSPTNAEKSSTAEIKVSMFQKALENVKDSEGREVLLLGLMQEITKIWAIDKILCCWRKVIQENRQSTRLWTKYLDFMQTNFTYFRFEEVRSVYLDCLKLIHGARASGEVSLDEQNKSFDIQIYVVLRMTLFMRESGFTEHANAAWQALLEFVFFKPVIVQASDHDKDKVSHETTISNFEKFWDSEVPRVGEEGAKGWASFVQQQGEPPQPRIEIADGLEDSNDLWKSWIELERKHNLLSRNPARTIDDTEVDDPYRIILFSDIRPFLIDPPSRAGQQLILDALIVFCCLPPFVAEASDNCSKVRERDCFLCNHALRLNGKLQDSWKLQSPKQSGSTEEQDSTDKKDAWLHSGTQSPFQFPVLDYQVSPDSLFADKQWVSAFDTWQEQCSGDGGPVEVAWVMRLLKSLINVGAGGEAVASYVLALELRTSPGTVRKTAKTMIRKQNFSIRLYNAYALVEYRLTGTKRGESIIVTSINMSKEMDEISRRDSILLWRTWIWETLSANLVQEALVRLLAIGDDEIQMPFPELHESNDLSSARPALLLRTESVGKSRREVDHADNSQAFIAIRDQMLSLGSSSHATFAIECLILFAYLKNAQSISAATSAFKSNMALLSTHIPSKSTGHEYLYQSFARLLHYHATHTHLCKPSDIRLHLAESIARFPQNTLFLSLYAWNEARFRIDDRVRSVVKELVLGGSSETRSKAQHSVIPHFFAIYSELHRGVTFGSNICTVRSAFERAVESDSGAHCAGLWKLYFLFEHSRSETSRAKTVFWRGVRACPWVKDLYMLAFEHLGGGKVMGEADLRGIYELLGEKELRVHVGLEDILQGSDERQADHRGRGDAQNPPQCRED